MLSRYEITIAKSSKNVDLEAGQKEGNYSCKIDGETKNISVEKKDASLLISIDNKMYSVTRIRRKARSVQFLANGRSIEALIRIHEKTEEGTGITSLEDLVTSNFPAKVIAIKVSEGDSLKEGETMLVLEAMKMEAQVKAPRDCTVLEVFVREGEMVPRGAKLLQLRFE